MKIFGPAVGKFHSNLAHVVHALLKAIKIRLEYPRSHSRENTLKLYQMVLTNLDREFGARNGREITSDEIFSFLNRITEGAKQQTNRTRYAHLSSLFNFIRNNIDETLQNPCDTPMMKKLFRNTGMVRWNTIEKDTVDDIIFNTVKAKEPTADWVDGRRKMKIEEIL